MSLANGVQFATLPGQTITWLRDDGTAENITGATLSGVIRNATNGAARAIAGTLAVVDGPEGIFSWTYDADDVAEAGLFYVQFSAEIGELATSASTYSMVWEVLPALVVDEGEGA